MLISLIQKKSEAGWELEEKQKSILMQNAKQMNSKSPRQLPKLLQKPTASNIQLPNHQTPSRKLNVSTPSCPKGRGRKRKRTERLTDSEEESESEEVI